MCRLSVPPQWCIGCETPQMIRQRSATLTQCAHRARVSDHGLDLAAVSHNACIVDKSLDVSRSKRGHGVNVEVRERAAEVLPLAQDRQPGQPRLKSFE